MKDFLTTENKHGVRVTICCSSCYYKYKEETIRRCVCKQKNRDCNGRDCENWRMTRRLKEYLMFLLKIREKEKDKGGLNPKTMSVEEIRSEYEIKYGSIYMEF